MFRSLEDIGFGGEPAHEPESSRVIMCMVRRDTDKCVLQSFRFDVDLPTIAAWLAPTNTSAHVTVQYSIALLRSSANKRLSSSGLSVI